MREARRARPGRSGVHLRQRPPALTFRRERCSRSRQMPRRASSPAAKAGGRQRHPMPFRTVPRRIGTLSHLGQHRCRRIEQRLESADRRTRLIASSHRRGITPCSRSEQEPKVGQVPARRWSSAADASSASSSSSESARRRSPVVAANRASSGSVRATPSRAIGRGGDHDHLGDTLGIAREVRGVGVGCKPRPRTRRTIKSGRAMQAGDRQASSRRRVRRQSSGRLCAAANARGRRGPRCASRWARWAWRRAPRAEGLARDAGHRVRPCRPSRAGLERGLGRTRASSPPARATATAWLNGVERLLRRRRADRTRRGRGRAGDRCECAGRARQRRRGVMHVRSSSGCRRAVTTFELAAWPGGAMRAIASAGRCCLALSSSLQHD